MAPDCLVTSQGTGWAPLETRSLLPVTGRNLTDEASREYEMAGVQKTEKLRSYSPYIWSPCFPCTIFLLLSRSQLSDPRAVSRPYEALPQSCVLCLSPGLISSTLLRTPLEITEAVPSLCVWFVTLGDTITSLVG